MATVFGTKQMFQIGCRAGGTEELINIGLCGDCVLLKQQGIKPGPGDYKKCQFYTGVRE